MFFVVLQRVLQYGYNVTTYTSVLMTQLSCISKWMGSAFTGVPVGGRLGLSFTLSQVLYFWTKLLNFDVEGSWTSLVPYSRRGFSWNTDWTFHPNLGKEGVRVISWGQHFKDPGPLFFFYYFVPEELCWSLSTIWLLNKDRKTNHY